MNKGNNVLIFADVNASTGQGYFDYIDMDDNDYTPVKDQYIYIYLMGRDREIVFNITIHL